MHPTIVLFSGKAQYKIFRICHFLPCTKEKEKYVLCKMSVLEELRQQGLSLDLCGI